MIALCRSSAEKILTDNYEVFWAERYSFLLAHILQNSAQSKWHHLHFSWYFLLQHKMTACI